MNILSETIENNLDNYLNTSTIFAESRRTILSKDFKGGKIRNIFGATALDFTHADIKGVAVLDVSQAFGEVTIAVPADWRVEADVTHLCSVVDEDRSYADRGYNSSKVLLIKGFSFFGVVDVVSCL